MCNIVDVNFTLNGSTYVPYCTVRSSDTVGAQVRINITEAPVNAYVMFTFDTPTGRKDYYANNGGLMGFPNNTTYAVNLNNFDTTTPGTYSFVGVTVMDDMKYNVLCGSTIAGNCMSLAVSNQYTLHWVVYGSGKITVWKNGTYIGDVIGGGSSQTFTFNVGDNFKYQAFPDPGWVYDATCDYTGCDSSNPFQATITEAIENTFTSNFGQPLTYSCANGQCTENPTPCSGTTNCYTEGTCGGQCTPAPKAYSCIGGFCRPATCDPSVDQNCYSRMDCLRKCCSYKCDPNSNICMGGQCMSKMILFGTAAVFLVMMMK